MEILKELYYGNITETHRKRKTLNPKLIEKEYSLYETLKSKLTKNDGNIIDEFIDLIYERTDEDSIDKYIQGLKTGILIGIEVGRLEL